MRTSSARLLPQLSARVLAGQSSAIRDLLDQARQPGMISLAGGLPDPTMFPTEQLATIAATQLRCPATLQYGPTPGDDRARSALGRLFEPNADPTAVVVTTGSQQALDLISRVVVDAGDQVVVCDPDYLGALQVFQSHGAQVIGIGIDSDGLCTEALEAALRSGLRPKCCYVVPHFHNPTGATMTPARRGHLQTLAATYGFLVIEDDPYRDLYFDTEPTDVAFDPELTVRLRSTSKILAPGLRVGALQGPKWLVDPLVIAKQSADLHTSSLSQAIVTEALESSWFDRHLEQLRSTYGHKCDVLATALRDQFGPDITFEIPAGGMFLWAAFRGVADTSDWLQTCLQRGVCFVPGTAFAVDRELRSYARFSFSSSTPAQLEEAVTRLAAAL